MFVFLFVLLQVFLFQKNMCICLALASTIWNFLADPSTERMEWFTWICLVTLSALFVFARHNMGYHILTLKVQKSDFNLVLTCANLTILKNQLIMYQLLIFKIGYIGNIRNQKLSIDIYLMNTNMILCVTQRILVGMVFFKCASIEVICRQLMLIVVKIVPKEPCKLSFLNNIRCFI